MEMYNDTRNGEKIVSYTVTDKNSSNNIKVFSSTKKDIAYNAFLNWYDIAVYDGEYENLSTQIVESITTRNRFRAAIKDGLASIMLPNFSDIENYVADADGGDEEFIYIVYCDDRKTVWDVVNGADITW